MKPNLFVLFLILHASLTVAWIEDRPILESHDGHLTLSAAKDRNITLKTVGQGSVNLNGINLLHIAYSAQNASRLVERWKFSSLAEVQTNLQRLSEIIEGPMGLQKRLNTIEFGGDNPNITTHKSHDTTPGDDRPELYLHLSDRVRRVEARVRTIVSKLRVNECNSNPCLNGGSCYDLYDGYQCHCSSSWEGPNCGMDVNECSRYLGTDLGCQNGATCVNTLGSYQCLCAPGWYGLHCTEKSSACDTTTSQELCGHGFCVKKPGTPLGYTCICEQGWQSDGTNPACVKDVDECAANHPPCSINPPVPCINVPGKFFCGGCPFGYTGNGYYCIDIDECQVDNGGCSTTPKVQCINTLGSRICGQCPLGYQGDGVTCVFVGACRINNGGCHHLATCVDNPGLSSLVVQCKCPPGYRGSGIGPQGCETTGLVVPTCANNPCVHGTCATLGDQGYICHCYAGYAGRNCDIQADPCTPNPCKNGGSCNISVSRTAVCECTAAFTGLRCETARQACGETLRNPSGTLEYPRTATTYQNNLNCAWQFVTDQSKVLNITFTKFDLESSTHCGSDFLQIHDGWNSGTYLIGRFCGNKFPNNGTIISSHNTLYFWFHTDSSKSFGGFSLHWESIDPLCGGYLEAEHGAIQSPGTPGKYPPNRDCYWNVKVKPGRRIQFHFFSVMLEESPSCEKDFLEINDTASWEPKRLGRYCNHSTPAPLTTISNEAQVYFHSDSAVQDSGFQITFSSVPGLSNCGGEITDKPKGIIHSPLGTDGYESNLECVWTITLPENSRIKITWLSMDMEDTDGCFADSLQIRDGNSEEDPLIGTFCGSDLPQPIVSTSNKLYIMFESDWSLSGEGFKLSYEVACGGHYHEDTGVLSSPFYPKEYPPSMSCVYHISVAPTKKIVLDIVDIDMEETLYNDECALDYLTVYDGYDEDAPLLTQLCDSSSSENRDPIVSTYNNMYLVFTSDASFGGRGFNITYRTEDTRCGGVITSPSGVIRSPGDGGSYDNDERCTWIIRAPPGFVVQLTWLSFHLEPHSQCAHDYVKVYENVTSEESVLLGTFCGQTNPPVITSQDRTMTIFFKTDLSVTREGFTVSYLFLNATEFCGGHYHSESGVITTPNYPESYPNNRDCVWVVQAPNGQRVKLTVDQFKLEKQYRCRFDYLEIRNGGYDTSPLIGKYCNSDIPTEIMSAGNQIYLKFHSDASRFYEGFRIFWDNTVKGCGATMNTQIGDIQSPNYPQNYAHRSNCMWKVTVSAGSVIEFVIVDFDMESSINCVHDYLAIIEGNTQRAPKVSEKYCKNTHPSLIRTKSNLATVRFRSDFSNSGRGFHVRYKTLCNNVLTGFSGIIESPNFPNKYNHLANCSWVIKVPLGNRVNISFSHFALENATDHSCEYDYVEIREGENDKPNTNLGKFCGRDKLPDRIHSSQSQVFVDFHSDVFVSFGGFRLEWFIDGCGGHLTRPTDVIESPGYPSFRSNVVCEWLIEVDATKSVQLTVQQIDVTHRTACEENGMYVYGGEDASAPMLTHFCHSDKAIVVTSPGNKMFLRYNALPGSTGTGFTGSYDSMELQCGGFFNAPTGVIHSPKYPQNYPPKLTCEWFIQLDQHHTVNLTFTDFDVEAGSECNNDYVEIFDGLTKDDNSLGKFCSHELPPTIVSTGNAMLIYMKSDSLISSKGFKANYARSCGGTIVVEDNGVLSPTSNLGMHEYLQNCTWKLIAKNLEDHVTLTFTYMQISDEICQYAGDNRGIEIYDGDSVEGVLLGNYCGSKVPAPITSSGNALTVHLHSTTTELLNKLNFYASYSVLNNACGGEYYTTKGTIASPGYPESYPLNVECEWTIRVTPGSRVSLQFTDFHMESSKNCDLDYLEIRENGGAGKLLGVSCGEIIENIESSTSLWVKFKSDGVGTAKGFKADFSFLPQVDLNGPTGEIASPLYPRPIREKLKEYQWRITVETGFVIRIVVDDMRFASDPKDCVSGMSIYDGYNNEAPLLQKLCAVRKSGVIQSSSNVMFIFVRFLDTSGWFHLTWQQIPRDLRNDEGTEVIELSKCNEEIALVNVSDFLYTISSPGYPNGYESDLKCNWLISTPPGTHVIVKFLTVDLEVTSECVADYVAVYNGNAMTSTDGTQLLRKVCQRNDSYISVSGSNLVTVQFVSDYYANKTGFQARVFRGCGGQLSGPNGEIAIDNTTNFFGLNNWGYSCEWNITVRPGRTIEVTFVEMNIQVPKDGPNSAASLCGSDFIMLKNGEYESSPLLGNGKYCGNDLPEPLQTTGNKLYIKASGRRRRLSFKLKYREIGLNCGGNYNLRSVEQQFVTSPNYPNIPTPYSECFWTFMAPGGEPVSIHFTGRFDLASTPNCEREYVEVRDGGTEYSKLLGRFCSDKPPSSLTTTGNVLYLHFYTDLPEPKNGFKALLSTGICGGIIRASKGTISSPNYPNPYPKDTYCTWRIIAPMEQPIRMEFKDLSMPGYNSCEGNDRVYISEVAPGNDTDLEIGTYCGKDKPGMIQSRFGEVIVEFKSYDKDHFRANGFSLNFTTSRESCAKHLTALSGEIITPDYPRPSVRSRYCSWRIRVPDGYHIVLDIEDYNAGSSRQISSNSLTIYNDHNYVSKIIQIRSNQTLDRVSSTSNMMTINYWSAAGHRGFRGRYRAVSPPLCGGHINDLEGVFTSPTTRPLNETTYICVFNLRAPDELIGPYNNTNLTLALTLTGRAGMHLAHGFGCAYYGQNIVVLDKGKSVGSFCGEHLNPPAITRSPGNSFQVKMVNGTYDGPGNMNATIHYKWHKCGGILRGPMDVIQAPKNVSYPVHCAWFVDYPALDEAVSLRFTRFNLGACDDEYIGIRKGNAFGPKLDRVCGNITPKNETSINSQFWIEYYSNKPAGDFEIQIGASMNTCGGTLVRPVNRLASPGFPKQYPNSAECVWEIQTEPGYHIGISFLDRFHIESSDNCTNDYLQVFDWVPKGTEGVYKEIGKLCGRNTPPPLNSTSNLMKIKFRSNEKVQGDGFQILWERNCGGILEVTEKKRILEIPTYRGFYDRNMLCNYTLVAPEGKTIIFSFTSFDIENKARGECKFDNVTVKRYEQWDYTSTEVFCGTEIPPVQQSFEKLEIVFKSDKYFQRRGFTAQYFLSDCEEVITEPTVIQPFLSQGKYISSLNCTWMVRAPVGKNVVARFTQFTLEHLSRVCVFDSVEIYNSTWTEPGKVLAKYCGNLTKNQLPVITTDTNFMTINFHSDAYDNFEGFKAEILFTSGSASGCGGSINLTDTKTIKIRKSEMQDSYLDCHWKVIAPPNKGIQFKITQMDLRNDTNISSTVACNGDYLELRDGLSQYSELIGKYCGSIPPIEVRSTFNLLWIRFVGVNSSGGTGFTAKMDVQNTFCGPHILTVTDKAQFLTSPWYPGTPTRKCRWIIKKPSTSYDTAIAIHFIDMDLEESEQCKGEALRIMEEGDRDLLNLENEEGNQDSYFVVNEVYGRSGGMSLSYTYCGKTIHHPYYSYKDSLEITYLPPPGPTLHHRGFNISYSFAQCDRNYTKDQGRIMHRGIGSCWFTITAPANHTISLYFNDISMYDDKQCTNTALQIRDGGFSDNVLATVCGMSTPNPIFSTGNKLSFHSWAESSPYTSYDLLYTTTDKGRGCGGKIYNFQGTFTSPLYPSIYRNNTECTWDIMVPHGNVVKFEFLIFDIGVKGSCKADSVKLYNVLKDGEHMLATTYCGGDNPSEFTTLANHVLVVYKSSVNNGGVGFNIKFVAVESSVASGDAQTYIHTTR